MLADSRPDQLSFCPEYITTFKVRTLSGRSGQALGILFEELQLTLTWWRGLSPAAQSRIDSAADNKFRAWSEWQQRPRCRRKPSGVRVGESRDESSIMHERRGWATWHSTKATATGTGTADLGARGHLRVELCIQDSCTKSIALSTGLGGRCVTWESVRVVCITRGCCGPPKKFFLRYTTPPCKTEQKIIVKLALVGNLIRAKNTSMPDNPWFSLPQDDCLHESRRVSSWAPAWLDASVQCWVTQSLYVLAQYTCC